MTVENEDDLEGLRAIGRVVAQTLRAVLDAVRPGVSTEALDALGARMLEDQGARSAPMISVGFPAALCISVNEEIAHGIPGARVIEAGDVVNVDVSAERDGYFADTGATTVVSPAQARDRRLCQATQAALDAALAMTRAGVLFRDVGRILERRARRAGLRVVRNLCSHGVGRALHEAPTMIPGYHEPRDTRRFTEGSVITLEPFFSTSSNWAEEGTDGWTLLNNPGGRSAQFEHTLVVTRGRPLIMTLP